MLEAPVVREAVHAALVRDDRLPPGPYAIFAALHQAGDEGVREEDLINRVRWGDARSFHAVLREVTRRIRNRTTIGALGYEALIGTRLVGSRLHFCLLPDARTAIDEIASLRSVLQLPVTDILATRNPENPQGDKSKWLRL